MRVPRLSVCNCGREVIAAPGLQLLHVVATSVVDEGLPVQVEDPFERTRAPRSIAKSKPRSKTMVFTELQLQRPLHPRLRRGHCELKQRRQRL